MVSTILMNKKVTVTVKEDWTEETIMTMLRREVSSLGCSFSKIFLFLKIQSFLVYPKPKELEN
jgi:hypothetical protein